MTSRTEKHLLVHCLRTALASLRHTARRLAPPRCASLVRTNCCDPVFPPCHVPLPDARRPSSARRIGHPRRAPRRGGERSTRSLARRRRATACRAAVPPRVVPRAPPGDRGSARGAGPPRRHGAGRVRDGGARSDVRVWVRAVRGRTGRGGRHSGAGRGGRGWSDATRGAAAAANGGLLTASAILHARSGRTFAFVAWQG